MAKKGDSLDSMLTDDLDSYNQSLSQMGAQDGFALFPRSDYQSDGWEPFLRKNPLEGSRFEGVAIAFQTRRRRLDNTRNTRSLEVNLDHFNRILSNRTLRSLSRHGIAGDKSEMGAKSDGLVLVDEDNQEYIANVTEPTEEQVRRFLNAEKLRILNQTEIIEPAKQEEEEERDDEEEMEEQDYERAMRTLALVQSAPCVIAWCLVLTGTGSSVFVVREKQHTYIQMLRRLLATGLGVKTFEIGVGKVLDTTSGTLSECCDIELTICTQDEVAALQIQDRLRELMATDVISQGLVRHGISVMAKLRRGPQMFAYGRGYDIVQRCIGEPAADLRRKLARWEWKLSKARILREKIARERDAERLRVEAEKRKAERRMWSDEALDADFEAQSSQVDERPVSVGQDCLATAAQDKNVGMQQTAATGSDGRGTPLTPLAPARAFSASATSASTTSGLLPGLPPTPGTTTGTGDGGLNLPAPRKKKTFTIGKGDTLKMSKDLHKDPPVLESNEPMHGFLLHDPAMRPSTALQHRMHEYGRHQATFASHAPRARSVPLLSPMTWTATKGEHTESQFTLSETLSTTRDSRSLNAGVETESSEKLQAYFAASLEAKRCPQKGQMTAMTRHMVSVRKQEQAERMVQKRAEELLRKKQIRERINQEKISGAHRRRQLLQKHRASRRSKSRSASPPPRSQEIYGAPPTQNDKGRVATRISATRENRAENAGDNFKRGESNFTRQSSVASQRTIRTPSAADSKRDTLLQEAPSGWDAGSPVGSLHAVMTNGCSIPVDSNQGVASPDLDSGDGPVPGHEIQLVTSEERGNSLDSEADVLVSRADVPEAPAKIECTVSGVEVSPISHKAVDSGNQSHGKVGKEKPAERNAKPQSRSKKAPKRKDQCSDVDTSPTGHTEAVHENRTGIDTDKDGMSISIPMQGKHTIIRTAPKKDKDQKKKGLGGKDKHTSAGNDVAEASHQELATEEVVDTDHGVPKDICLSPGSTRVGSPESRQRWKPTEATPPLESPYESEGPGFASPMRGVSFGDAKKKMSEQSGTHTGKKLAHYSKPHMIEQEVKVGDPAWHVAQIVSSKLHTADPDFAPIESNYKMEAEMCGAPTDRVAGPLKLVNTSRDGFKDCFICNNTRSVDISDVHEAVLDLMDSKALPTDGEIDCPHCCGIMPRFRKQPLDLNGGKWTQEPGEWIAPVYQPQAGDEMEVYQIHELTDLPAPNPATVSPRDCGITALAVDRDSASVCVADAQGHLVELDLASGQVSGKLYTPSKVNCLCLVDVFVYMGLEDCVQEARLAVDQERSSLERKFTGQKGPIISLAESPDKRLLVSGARDCTTWVWDLRRGRVLSYVPQLDSLVPPAVRHLAEELGISSAPRFTFAFQHHRGPVSCAATFNGGMVTGSWDGTACVTFLTGYKDRVDDSVLVPLAQQFLAPLRKKFRALKSEAVNLREEAEKQVNKKQAKFAAECLQEIEEKMARIDEQIKVLRAIDRVRVPRMRSTDRCRRFLYEPKVQLGRVLSAAHGVLSTGAHVIFAGYSDSAVRQWDLLTMTPMCLYVNTSSSVQTTPASFASLASLGEHLLTGYSDGSIKLWQIHQHNAGEGRGIYTSRHFALLAGHSDHIVGLQTMANILVSTSLDKTVRLWDVEQCIAFSLAEYERLGNETSDIADDSQHDQRSQATSRQDSPIPGLRKSVDNSHLGSVGGISTQGSKRLGNLGSMGSDSKSYLHGLEDLDPSLYTDTTYSDTAIEPHADLLAMTSLVSDLSSKLTATSNSGKELLGRNRSLIHLPKPVSKK